VIVSADGVRDPHVFGRRVVGRDEWMDLAVQATRVDVDLFGGVSDEVGG